MWCKRGTIGPAQERDVNPMKNLTQVERKAAQARSAAVCNLISTVSVLLRLADSGACIDLEDQDATPISRRLRAALAAVKK